MQIDFEVKAFAISIIFAAIKLFSLSAKNEMHLNGARAVFVLLHVYFLTLFVRTNMSIESTVGSKESKTSARSSVRKLFGSIALRAIVIAFVHLKTNMLPPLFVSSTLAFLSLLENEHCEAVLLKKKND